MKTKLALLGLALLVCVTGCAWLNWIVPVGPTLTLRLSPSSGYPPLVVEILAIIEGATGGNFRFVGGTQTCDQPENRLTVEVADLPCDVEVTWVGSGRLLTAAGTVGLRNSGPVVMRPVFNFKEDIWKLQPKQRYVVTFPGTYDKEGGPVRLVFASIFNKDQAAFNAIFCPPYLGTPPDIDEYRVRMPTGVIIENAFVFHENWPVILQSDVQTGPSIAELPYSPPGYAEANYPADLLDCIPEVAWPTGNIEGGGAILVAIFVDEEDARTTGIWDIPTGFYVGCSTVQTASATP